MTCLTYLNQGFWITDKVVVAQAAPVTLLDVTVSLQTLETFTMKSLKEKCTQDFFKKEIASTRAYLDFAKADMENMQAKLDILLAKDTGSNALAASEAS